MNINEKIARLDELRENRAQIDREIAELFGVYEGDGDETPVKPKAKLGRPKKTVELNFGRGIAKPCCGSLGPRHLKTCKLNGKPQPNLQDLSDRPKNDTAMNETQYNMLREEMFDTSFSSLIYAADNDLKIKEVNAALKSVTYRDYLNRR